MSADSRTLAARPRWREGVPWIDPARLARARGLVVGCGQLGSETALQLDRMGFGRLTLLDRDREDGTGRPKVEALAAILKAETELVFADVREVGLGYFAGYDFAVSSCDNGAARRRTHLAYWTGVPLISAATDGRGRLEGSLSVFDPRRGDLACPDCAPPPAGDQPLGIPCSAPAGEGRTAPTITTPYLAAAVASLAASQAVKLVLSPDKTLAGQMHFFEMVHDTFSTSRLALRKTCASPHRPWEIARPGGLPVATTTLPSLLETAGRCFGAADILVRVPEGIHPSRTCLGCGARDARPLLRRAALRAARCACGEGFALSAFDALFEIDRACAEKFARVTLAELGFPARELVTLVAGGAARIVELA